MATWTYYGTVTLGIWAKKAGAWQKQKQVTASVNASYSSGGARTLAFDRTFEVDLGPGVEAFGVTVDATDGDASAITDFVSATWSATATSSERSATPNGEKTTIVVIPQ